jgi:CRP/FNR family transcriptional regulator, cyclic AMP receptor protein
LSAPRRFAFANDCLSCTLRREGNFCQLPAETLASFNDTGYLTVFPGDVVLLAEGEIPRGVFVLCSGRAKLSITGHDGKVVILNIAGNRQLLGLSALVLGRPSPVTVTTVEYCQVKFVEQDDFLQLLTRNSSVALGCATALSRDVGKVFETLHEMLLARSSAGKLARLLLSMAGTKAGNHDLQVSSDFTHEEMAQMIGSSRETVTRVLGDMKRKELIRQVGAMLVIPDRIALQAIAA